MSSIVPTVLVYGGSGFVGSAVVEQLRKVGCDVRIARAPRLPSMAEADVRRFINQSPLVKELAREMGRCFCVVNAAGNPDASSLDADALTAVNAALPGLLGAAVATIVSRPRFVHVSSAVVQDRVSCLDDSPAQKGFSPYSRSKVLGERLVGEYAAGQVVTYRPPSVHAPGRRVTRLIAKVATSPVATVARPGSAPSPQALLVNVASAIAFLATTPEQPPGIVFHPSEGLTTSGLLEELSGRKPTELPRSLARYIVGAANAAGKAVPRLATDSRRLEMLWFGQAQAPSWLTAAGWQPPAGKEAWRALGAMVRTERAEAQQRTR